MALAMDEHNAKLVTPDMKKKLDAAQADIVAGRIKVRRHRRTTPGYGIAAMSTSAVRTWPGRRP